MRGVRFIPALGWAALIFFLSSRSSVPSFVDALPGMDKLVHATFYAVLAACLLFGAQALTRRRAWGCALFTSLYGITDELHQYFVPGRSCDILDWLADTAGGCACAWLWLLYQARDPHVAQL